MIGMSEHGDNGLVCAALLAEEYYIALQHAHRAMRETFLEVRESKNITQKVIADRLGWNKALVSRRLHGRGNLTFKTLSALATAMDCRLNVGFSPYDEMPRANYHYQETSSETGTSPAKPHGQDEGSKTPRSNVVVNIRRAA
jgi:transcriptional regulator with XRE-family HTH domain